MKYEIAVADVVQWCADYQGEPFHAVVCDPPYHLTSIQKRFGSSTAAPAKGDVYARSANGFMGQQWDGGNLAFDPDTWHAIARHVYPGGFILAFAGSRGWHRQATAMEDAGLIIHPTFFLYGFGSGFPKATRVKDNGKELPDFDGYRYGLQALKPAVEPIIIAQRPYEGRPVDCIKATGAGVWWVDGGRISYQSEKDLESATFGSRPDITGGGYNSKRVSNGNLLDTDIPGNPLGRWPSHLLLCHDPACRYTADGWQCVSECAVRRLGEMSGETVSNGGVCNTLGNNGIYNDYPKDRPGQNAGGLGDSGTAARFFFNGHYAYETFERLTHADSIFYTSKASTAAREAGLADLPSKTRKRKNHHPTIKPLDLTRYLCTLLLPPDAYAPRRILVPFSGAGSEMIGAALAGFDEIQGCELSPEYATIATHRLDWWIGQMAYGCTDPETILAAIRENSADTADGSQPRQLSLLDTPAARDALLDRSEARR